MFDIIESIILSDLMIFLVFSVMLLAVTSWAFRVGELPGYILGWLIGIFFIVIYSSLGGDDGSQTQETVENVEPTLTAVGVLLPAFFGLVFGFGLLFAVKMFGSTGARQGVLVALLTATLVSVIFFLAVSDDYSRRVVGIFALAFSIGALSTYVLKIGSYQSRAFTIRASSVQRPREPLAPAQFQEPPLQQQDIPEARINESPYQNRLETIRRFFTGER